MLKKKKNVLVVMMLWALLVLACIVDAQGDPSASASERPQMIKEARPVEQHASNLRGISRQLRPENPNSKNNQVLDQVVDWERNERAAVTGHFGIGGAGSSSTAALGSTTTNTHSNTSPFVNATTTKVLGGPFVNATANAAGEDSVGGSLAWTSENNTLVITSQTNNSNVTNFSFGTLNGSPSVLREFADGLKQQRWKNRRWRKRRRQQLREERRNEANQGNW